MTIEMIRGVFLWCFIINMGILLWWFMFLSMAHDWVFRLHGKWFKISVETFDTVHYAGISFFKIFIIVFNLVPYLALLIVS